MAAAAQFPYVPVEVYLNSSYEPDAEYVVRCDRGETHGGVRPFFVAVRD